MRTPSIVVALLLMAVAPRAAQVPASTEAGITGVVLHPDGSPVTQGAVTLMTSATSRVNATIDRTGHFRLLPDSPGWQRLFISVPGLAPHRLNVTVPPSRIMALPDITLGEATYFRARFVSIAGEPLGAAGLRRRAIDGDGVTIADPLGHVREQVEADGTLTLGPLFPGRMLLAFDRAPLAQTRVRDVDVTGTKPLIEGGVIAIATGARLLVDVVDGSGKPESPGPPPWQVRFADLLSRPRRVPIPAYSPPSCGGATDADGRFTMSPFPPGPAQLRVGLFNSSYVARVTIPEGGREMVIAIPDGLLPVRVTDQASQQPVPGARLIWLGGGGRVEAFATANGDALLEAVGATGGTLTISGRGHHPLEGSFDETPGLQQEVALKALTSTNVSVRVVNDEGEALAGAVVELVARNPREVAEFIVADAKGVGTFANVPPGNLQFTAHAAAFTPATVRITEENRGSITIALTRIQ